MSGDNEPRVAVVTAIPEELDAILSRAREVRRQRYGFFQGRIGASNVVLAATGDGVWQAGRRVAALCDVCRPSALLAAGVAGALSGQLRAGDLVASRRVRDASGEAPPPDDRLLSRALAASGVQAGTLVTVEKPAVTSAEKAVLAASLPDADPATVDMESAAWARESAARRIPYLIVRAVSDEAGEELPRYLSDCTDEKGSIHRRAVVARALANPTSIPALWRMWRRVRDGGARLADFIERFLSETG